MMIYVFILMWFSEDGPVNKGPYSRYKLRYIVGFWLVQMAISTNQKPTIYRNLNENTDDDPERAWGGLRGRPSLVNKAASWAYGKGVYRSRIISNQVSNQKRSLNVSYDKYWGNVT